MSAWNDAIEAAAMLFDNAANKARKTYEELDGELLDVRDRLAREASAYQACAAAVRDLKRRATKPLPASHTTEKNDG